MNASGDNITAFAVRLRRSDFSIGTTWPAEAKLWLLSTRSARALPYTNGLRSRASNLPVQ